jgi:hypothetical protein
MSQRIQEQIENTPKPYYLAYKCLISAKKPEHASVPLSQKLLPVLFVDLVNSLIGSTAYCR